MMLRYTLACPEGAAEIEQAVSAVLDQGYAPEPERGPVTGTGTDCVVLACPTGEPRSAFAGLHTAVGEAIGAAVLQATGEAMAFWIQEQGLTSRP